MVKPACLLMLTVVAVTAHAAPPLAQQLKEVRARLEAAFTGLTTVVAEVDPIIRTNGPDGVSAEDIARVMEAWGQVAGASRAALRFYEENRVALGNDPVAASQAKQIREMIDGQRELAIRLVQNMAKQTQKARESEAKTTLRGLYTAEKSYFGERDRYTADYAQLGWEPVACPDGTRPSVPSRGWVAGCNFIYRVEIQGQGAKATFTGYAVGVGPNVLGMEVKVASDGEPVKTKDAK
jgi:hypothetical protein